MTGARWRHLYEDEDLERGGLYDTVMINNCIAYRDTLGMFTREDLGLGALRLDDDDRPIVHVSSQKPRTMQRLQLQISKRQPSSVDTFSAAEGDDLDPIELWSTYYPSDDEGSLDAYVDAAEDMEDEANEEAEQIRQALCESRSAPARTEELPKEILFQPGLQQGPEGQLLSCEQLLVYHHVEQGKSVYFSGAAGTGKTYLLLLLKAMLEKKHQKHKVGTVAPTGLASLAIGGRTLHSWAGIGLGVGDRQTILDRILKRPDVVKRWVDAICLIIDEVSMVHGDVWDLLEWLARSIRRKRAHFGGLQLVVSGDPCQLPPMPRASGVIPFFKAETWNHCIKYKIRFTTILRQQDLDFIEALNNLRMGHVPASTERFFKRLDRQPTWDDHLPCVELFCTRAEIRDRNKSMLNTLPGKTWIGTAKDKSSLSDAQRRKLLRDVAAPEHIFLKTGAPVMHLRNDYKNNLVNGSLGIVVGFATYRTWLYPIKGVWQCSPDERDAHPVVDWYTDEIDVMNRVFMESNLWKVPFGHESATREQYPIMLAWAITVHKSQGMTIPRVIVHLGRAFERGQAYVGLSRVRFAKDLIVRNFMTKKVKYDRDAVEWESKLPAGPYAFEKEH